MIDKAVEEQIVEWVKSVAEHTKPLSIHWCDGTAAEARRLEQEMESVPGKRGACHIGAASP
jgi:GTP-dependent phosphoenolpyruvate carboxykinase